MRFKKTIAAGVAACVMAASAASLVKNVSALSAETPAAATDVMIELVGVTDDYAARVPLSVVLDNMTYAHDIFGEDFDEVVEDSEGETSGVPESDPNTQESETAPEPEEASEPGSEEASAPEGEPAAAPEASEESGEPANIPENADNGESVEVVPETPEIPEPAHKRGDKVELPEGAEFVWVDGEKYSITDKTAALDLFLEDSADEYIINKAVTIGSGEEKDEGNALYNAKFKITKNRWTFDDFKLYTVNAAIDETEEIEETELNALLCEIGVNSVRYLFPSPIDGERDVYLKLSPRFIANGEVVDGVDVDVLYRGVDPKDERILTGGAIIVDLLAFDAEHNLIAEQRGVEITAAAGAIRVGAALDSDTETGEALVVIDEACALDSAELNAALEAALFGSEHAIKLSPLIVEGLAPEAAELSEEDVLKAALGRFDSLEDAFEAEDIKAALFGEGFVAAIDEGTELTIFIEKRAVFGISASEEAFALHIRFGVKADVEDQGTPVTPEDPKPETPEDPEDPENPENPEDPTEPEDPETVELNFDGDSGRVYFDNISKGEAVLEITSNTDNLSGFNATLDDGVLVTLGDVEVSGGSAAITLLGVRDADGELLRGGVSGTLTITADNAEPLVITLGGESGSARITERKTWDTAMKYVPYLAEYSLDREYPWLSAEYSVIGELPEGLELDAESGKLSGAPTVPGKYSFEIAATLTYTDVEDSPSATITREVGFTVANNTAGNLYMLTDPDYGFYRPLGEDIDGRAYYLDTDEISQELKATLKGECSEFYDLWLDGVKLTRRSDEYKTYHGATEITFDAGAFSWLTEDEIHTLVFAYKPNSSDNLKLAAQNVIITSDKSAIAPVEGASRDYYNMYTPTSRLDAELDSDYARALSSVRLYAASGALPAGVKTLVRANTEESKGGVGMDIIIADEDGEAILPDGSVTAKMTLPEWFGEDVFVYFLEDDKYIEASATVRDNQVFFTLDGSKTVIVSQRTIDPNAKSSGNPATGVALSSAGLAISGAAFVMILTSKRKKSE